jgi:hypothetical protein
VRKDETEQKAREACERKDEQEDPADDQCGDFPFVLRLRWSDAQIDRIEVMHERQEHAACIAGFDLRSHCSQDKHSRGGVQQLTSQARAVRVTDRLGRLHPAPCT